MQVRLDQWFWYVYSKPAVSEWDSCVCHPCTCINNMHFKVLDVKKPITGLYALFHVMPLFLLCRGTCLCWWWVDFTKAYELAVSTVLKGSFILPSLISYFKSYPVRGSCNLPMPIFRCNFWVKLKLFSSHFMPTKCITFILRSRESKEISNLQLWSNILFVICLKGFVYNF